MTVTDHHAERRALDALLCGVARASAQEWAAARAGFVARAASEDLVDIAFEDHETPLGRIRINATDTGILRIILPIENTEEVLEDLARNVSGRILGVSTPAITTTRRELDEYFEGRRRRFEVPLDWTLATPFRRDVLHATALIPYGETSSYRQVAIAAGRPKAVRAAGSALSHNPLPIIVPCHRVLRTDGGIGQYLGGVAAKTQLLTLEGGLR
jgi:methylated-DNA-[protein]-cysteine S-methyltransferase